MNREQDESLWDAALAVICFVIAVGSVFGTFLLVMPK